MADVSLTAIEDSQWVVESPQPTVVGESIAFTVTFSWVASVSSPTVTIYKEDTTTDLAGTLITGSASASGNVVTTGAVHALAANERYVLAVTATVSSQTQVRKLKLICQGAGDG